MGASTSVRYTGPFVIVNVDDLENAINFLKEIFARANGGTIVCEIGVPFSVENLSTASLSEDKELKVVSPKPKSPLIERLLSAKKKHRSSIAH